MAAVWLPQGSTVTLHRNVDIEFTEGLEIVFQNRAAQQAYFASHAAKTISNCSYIRRTGQIKLQVTMEEALSCNFMSWRNPNYENITFYARISNPEMVNNKTTAFSYQIDWFQTFMFDVKFRDCLIKREHLKASDTAAISVNHNKIYDKSIPELMTDEPVATGKELEAVYGFVIDNSVPSGSSSAMGPDGKPGTAAPSNICTMVIVADFDTSETDPSGLVSAFDEVYSDTLPGAKTYVNYAKIVRPYSVCVASTAEQLKNGLAWLTLNGLDNNILGAYAVPKNVIDEYFSSNADIGQVICAEPNSGYMEKLDMSPFSYVRVTTASNTKEYKFEESGGEITLELYAILDGVPKISMMPQHYRYSGADTRGIDISDRLDCTPFPQVPYSTDAYLAHLATVYSNAIGSNTRSTEQMIAAQQLQSTTGTISRVLKDAFGVVGGGYGALAIGSGPGDIAMGMAQYQQQQDKLDAIAGMEGVRAASGEQAEAVANGDIVSSVFGASKPAYVADEYHPGASMGFEEYFLGRWKGPGSFLVTSVRPCDSIMKMYDKYFRRYGYASNRVGVPRVCSYFSASGDQADGEPTFIDNATYVQTEGCKASTPLAIGDQFISNLFNAGCRFLRV